MLEDFEENTLNGVIGWLRPWKMATCQMGESCTHFTNTIIKSLNFLCVCERERECVCVRYLP